MKEQFQAWWESISLRERQLTILSGVFILVALIYWGAWKPLSNQLTTSQSELLRAQQTLSWVQDKAPLLANSGAAKSGHQGQRSSLAHVVNSSAKQHQVTFARVVNNKEQIEVWINEIEFDLFVEWLTTLNNQYAVSVISADVSQIDKNGFVKINRLVLAY